MIPEESAYIGGVMAVQGIRDATILLHGQNGCRHAVIPAMSVMPRGWRPPLPDVPFYSGTRGVPYSGLTVIDCDGTSQGRFDSASDHVLSEDYELIVGMCSPGMSIYGDDLGKADARYMEVDPDSLGGTTCEGFDRTLRTILESCLYEDAGEERDTVNLLGMGLLHRDWQAVVQEFSHILMNAGLNVVCALGAGCSMDDVHRSASAGFCIDLCPEYCRETSEFYRSLGIPVISTGDSPVGFDAVASLYGRIEDVTGHGLPRAYGMLDRCRSRAYDAILSSGKEMTGVSFSVESVGSVRRPLSSWLETSLGMVRDDDCPDVLFSSGRRAALMENAGRCLRGVGMGYPFGKGTDFIKRPILGQDGAMHILDEVFSCRTPLP